VTEIIAIVNEKGGTGKTTTAVNLSAALGELGRKVLLVDLDGQAASSRWLGVEDDTRFADALWSGEAFEPIPEVVPGVSLAPGSGKLDSVAHDLRPTQGGQLRKVLGQLGGFDHIIIDCPPSLGNRLIGNALLAATHAIVPVEASILALDGLKILLTTFQDVRDGFGHDIALRGVLACRYDHRTRLSRLVLAELNRALPGRVFSTVIRENIRMRECPGSGKSILTYAPDSHAAEDYRMLAKEFLAVMTGEAKPRADGTLAETELSEEERQAILDIRGQVKAMLQATEPRSPRASSDTGRAGAAGGGTRVGFAGMPDEDEIDALAQSVKIGGPLQLDPLPPPPSEELPEAAEPAEAMTHSEQPPHVDGPTAQELSSAPEAPSPDAAPEPAIASSQVEPLVTSEAGQPAVSETEPAGVSNVESASAAPGFGALDRTSPGEPGRTGPGELGRADETSNGLQSRTDAAEQEPLPAGEPLPAVAAAPEEPPSEAIPEADGGRGDMPADAETPQQAQPAGAGEPAEPASGSQAPSADAAQAQQPPVGKDNMAALRAVLESMKKQSSSADQQQDAKKGPVWRRLFNKRSA
jgi:chromosome partitioning protein